jgi:predicted O-methyltransferase YrrM
MDLDSIKPALDTEGAMSPEELYYLYEQAQCVRDGCIVEIGSWRGQSTIALATGSKRAYNVRVYCVEPHETAKGILGGTFGHTDRIEFFKNMLRAEVLDIVRLVNLSSEYITHNWPHSVGLLFIDGNHGYKSVKRDIECWGPHLRPDATVVFDDAMEERIGPYHVVARD